MRSSVNFFYLLISRSATVPGLYLWGFLTPPSGLGGELLPGGLSSGGLTGGLLGASHSIINFT